MGMVVVMGSLMTELSLMVMVSVHSTAGLHASINVF
jgi:hypothetical protein